jgi:O-acetyl-ADP-ribose deacetylase (regulator of RNase III)
VDLRENECFINVDTNQCPVTETANKRRVIEIEGDVFKTTTDAALAHCVSADLAMNGGIALLFKEKFGRIEILKKLNPQVGKCYYLNVEWRMVFYLVTKQAVHHNVTYSSLESSLVDMRRLITKYEVKAVAIPRIGCGLDQLEWTRVNMILNKTFHNSAVKITAYTLPDPIAGGTRHTGSNALESTLGDIWKLSAHAATELTSETTLSSDTYGSVVHVPLVENYHRARCVIKVVVNGKEIPSLVDTGADSCFMADDMRKQLDLEIDKYDCEVIVGNNERLDVLGLVRLTIRIHEN